MAVELETFRYDDRYPRLFFLAAMIWAVVGMGVGFLVSAAVIQLVVIGLHNLRGGDSRTVAYTKVVGELPRPPAGPRR